MQENVSQRVEAEFGYRRRGFTQNLRSMSKKKRESSRLVLRARSSTVGRK